MSLEEHKAATIPLTQEEQDHLATYFIRLRHQRPAEVRRKIIAQISTLKSSTREKGKGTRL